MTEAQVERIASQLGKDMLRNDWTVEQALRRGVTLGMYMEMRAEVDALGAALGVPAGRRRVTKGAVRCPAVDCQTTGVKPLNCFCRYHFETLSSTEREQLLAAKAQAKRTSRTSHHADPLP